MLHGYDYIPRFLSLFNIAVSLDYLFQRVPSVNDCFVLSCLDKLLEEAQIIAFHPD